MRNYFEFTRKYKFEYNDLRAFITVINVALIMKFGLSIAWFGLVIAFIGLVKDIVKDHRVNGMVMHLANMVLNIYFILIM